MRATRAFARIGPKPHVRRTTLGGATIADWDFSQGIATQRIVDVGPQAAHGRLVNLPTRAYDHAHPDKYRLPLDTDLIPFRFDEKLGG